MDTAVEVLRYVTLIAFIALAVVGTWQWYKRRDQPTKWLALTFLSIGLVAVAGLFTPEEIDSTALQWVVKIEILVLILFPYLLFRFSASFGGMTRRTEWLAGILTGIVAVWTLLLSRLPEENEEPTG